jgi:DNA-binding NtrC family response regulator
MPAIKLTEDAVDVLQAYPWPGNVRQLKNLVEQLSVIETKREIDGFMLTSYLPQPNEKVTALVGAKNTDSFSERELMYKFLFDMKKDLTELKKLVIDVIGQGLSTPLNTDQNEVLNRIYQEVNETNSLIPRVLPAPSVETNYQIKSTDSFEVHEEVEESLSLEDREKELIRKALDKHRGKRKYAANELGISERTLYRKIKEYNLTDL